MFLLKEIAAPLATGGEQHAECDGTTVGSFLSCHQFTTCVSYDIVNVPNKFYVTQFNPTISYLGLCLNEIILDVRKGVCGCNNGGIIFLVSIPEYTRNIHIFSSF